MTANDQEQIWIQLEKQKKIQSKVDRVLKFVLPITAFLLSMICANLNWQSTVTTFLMLAVTFYAVGIKRFTLWHWIALLIIYCLFDNYFSFGKLNLLALRTQLGCMLFFTVLVGLGRPYLDRWATRSNRTT